MPFRRLQIRRTDEREKVHKLSSPKSLWPISFSSIWLVQLEFDAQVGIEPNCLSHASSERKKKTPLAVETQTEPQASFFLVFHFLSFPKSAAREKEGKKRYDFVHADE